MKKFELFYPTKPFKITQSWGILNLSYQRFGFTRHNGVDIEMPSDKKLRCPIQMKIIAQEYFPQGGGYQVKALTTEKWEFPDGKICYVMLAFLHNERFLHSVGDILEIGDEIAVPDNTGFSTGPHIHFGSYRLNDNMTFMDTNEAQSSFDPVPYFNKYFAVDSKLVISILSSIIETYKLIINKFTKE